MRAGLLLPGQDRAVRPAAYQLLRLAAWSANAWALAAELSVRHCPLWMARTCNRVVT